ncbi:MAG: metallophosphoesterase family protein [Longibaculum sp.]
MKILVVSDSHRFDDYLVQVTQLYKDQVDYMIHCGDSSLPMDDDLLKPFDIVVKGNHDDAPFPHYEILKNICITHGQYYNVYYGYDQLIQLCQQNHCSICFHGHTHVPTHQIHEGIHFINPGSLMMNRGSYGFGTYAIVDINEENIKVTYYHHETHLPVQNYILEEGLGLLEEFKVILKENKTY